LQTLLLPLHEKRKGVLLSFLHEAKLIRKEEITPYEHTKEVSELKGEERWKYPILRLNDIDFSRTELSPDTKLTFDDLRGIILRYAKLSKVNLSGANLKNADLRDADLRGAVLRKANRKDADKIPGEFHTDVDKAKMCGEFPKGLMETDLREADLSRADLSRADLSRADSRANLQGALLQRARLREADLREAILSGAYLNDADLRSANLSHANLATAKGVTNKQLSAALSLEGAIMPDGQTLRGDKTPNGPTFEDWLKDKKAQGKDGKNPGP
jgi:uncharacterized protein YjbI with pentapeptide repeats